MKPVATPRSVLATRAAAIGLAVAAAIAAVLLFLQFAAAAGLQWLDVLRAALIGATTFWLAWGAVQGLLGLLYRERRPPRLAESQVPSGRTALLMPIYHENPAATFSRLAAMDASLAETGLAHLFDIAVLSDTRDEAAARAEAFWFTRLVDERDGRRRMFYRRRATNVGRKAGNIGDFITRSGGAYDYALILDADSLMEGATIVEMVRRMEADPRLGLLQTLPRIIRAQSIFGRAMQFSASFYSPIFARGLAALQGPAGPFWGHNALIRVRAFAESCHLPPLSGPPPFGGHILSHDYVEAALLARGGWRVRLDPDLFGSFEEGPDDLLDYAKRDRRWCQGNLQYVRLLGAPGLTGWSRFALLQATLGYVVPLFWLALLSTAVPAVLWHEPPEYFPEGGSLFPVFPDDETAKAVGLALGVVTLLLVPKLAILVKALFKGAAPSFGGPGRTGASVVAELLLSTLIAPVMLMFQTRAVLQILAGFDGGWPASARGRETIPLSLAWRATWWIVATGSAGVAGVAAAAPELLPWLLPVALPMVAAPLLVAGTSHAAGHGLFRTPEELTPSPVVARARQVLNDWQAPVPTGAGAAAHG
ncbi:glucans biosynthesis glucosyltransferase MdoH [Roseitranquillus sediminis]|uniref:glucans biosynthesis glucosyltransferase MdoH n=1 Tax=Roseitranquillus sediminis TaxID=2809051 RepID=UPI001D0CC1EF|nr:glucans biosynthesis glucosyltransferase MdoH [Roseitranquillus sediminis]MBM9592985.1 glucans biosynthesis glucosyltransferase MdoH [Roseitranquillus sediminis]